jgi:hypothetical protein
MEGICEVVPYCFEPLIHLIAAFVETESSREVLGKAQSEYFKRYFLDLGAQTIVVERRYIDRAFLEDYAAYYVRCFKPYRKECMRLHFFRNEFDIDSFGTLLSGTSESLSSESLQANYLGFIVIKPLPLTFVGRTCLRTYDPDNGRRQYPAKREYLSNLFGIQLKVDTLAFQEQDKVAAACATSALWSVLNRTAEVFGHALPSPVEITKSATRFSLPETRVLPGTGLTIEQMAQAIREVGLEHEFVDVSKHPLDLKSSIYAYLRAGLPAILVADLWEFRDSVPLRYLARHAVAVTGYSLPPGRIKASSSAGLLLTASGMDKLYVHDDQVGPFAKMRFLEDAFSSSDAPYALSTCLPPDDGTATSVCARPIVLLIPVYHKIRIGLHCVLSQVNQFSQLAELALDNLAWEVFLTTVNRLKEDVLTWPGLDADYRRAILLTPMPRFMWRADAFLDGQRILGLLFDATDIELGHQFFYAIEPSEQLSRFFAEVGRRADLEKYFSPQTWRIVTWFSRHSRFADVQAPAEPSPAL